MKPYFPSKQLEEENDRLIDLFLSIKDNIDVKDFIEQNASPELKKFLKDDEIERERLWKEKRVLV